MNKSHYKIHIYNSNSKIYQLENRYIYFYKANYKSFDILYKYNYVLWNYFSFRASSSTPEKLAKTSFDDEIRRICAEKRVEPVELVDRELLTRIYDEEVLKGMFIHSNSIKFLFRSILPIYKFFDLNILVFIWLFTIQC